MSTFKEYAKRAKERMKSGFWEQAKQNILTEKQVADRKSTRLNSSH